MAQKSLSNQNSGQQISKGLSPKLEQKINVANKQWGKAKDSVLNVYKQALEDGWTPIEAAKICRENLVIFSPRTIRGILPDEAKNQKMKRIQGQTLNVQAARPQIAESLPQNVVNTEEKQQEVSLQQSSYTPSAMSEQTEKREKGRGEEGDNYEQPAQSPISIEEERKHDDSVDDQYHNMKNLIELLSGVDYLEEKDSNLALVSKTKEHRFKVVKQLSDLDVKAIYTYGRTLAHILNDYLKLLDDELDIRKTKEKLLSE